MNIKELELIFNYLHCVFPNYTFTLTCFDCWDWTIQCNEISAICFNWDSDYKKTFEEIKKLIDNRAI